MKKLYLICLLMLIFVGLVAESSTTIEYPVRMAPGMGNERRSIELPLKLTYTISNDKPLYQKGDEIIVDMTFELIPNDPHYFAEGKIDIKIIDPEDLKASYEKDVYKIKMIGKKEFTLNDSNKKVHTKVKIILKQENYNNAILGYEIKASQIFWLTKESLKNLDSERLQYIIKENFNSINDIFKKNIEDSDKFNVKPLKYQIPNNEKILLPLLKGTNFRFYQVNTGFSPICGYQMITNINPNQYTFTHDSNWQYVDFMSNSPAGTSIQVNVWGIVNGVMVYKYFDFYIVDYYKLDLKFVTEKIQEITNPSSATYIPIKMIDKIRVYSFGYGSSLEMFQNTFKKPSYIDDFNDLIVEQDPIDNSNESYLSLIELYANGNQNKGAIGVEIVLKNKGLQLLTDIGSQANYPSIPANIFSIFKPKTIWISFDHPEYYAYNSSDWGSTNHLIKMKTSFVRAGTSSLVLSNNNKILNKTWVGNFYTLQEATRYFDAMNINYAQTNPIYIYANLESTTSFNNAPNFHTSSSGYPFIFIKGNNTVNNFHRIWDNNVLFHELTHANDITIGSNQYNIGQSDEYWWNAPALNGTDIVFDLPFCEANAFFQPSYFKDAFPPTGNSLDNFIEDNNVIINSNALKPFGTSYPNQNSVLVNSIFYNLTNIGQLEFQNNSNPNINNTNESAATVQKIVNLLWDLYDRASTIYNNQGTNTALIQNNDNDETGLPPYSGDIGTFIDGLNNCANVFEFITFIKKSYQGNNLDAQYSSFDNFLLSNYKLSHTRIVNDNNTLLTLINTSSSGMKKLTYPINVPVNKSINIPNGANIKFEDFGKIIVDGVLNIGNDVTIYGKDAKNKIIVNGNGCIIIGTNVKFEKAADSNVQYWGGLEINDKTSIYLPKFYISNAEINIKNSTVDFSQLEMNESRFFANASSVSINRASFTRSNIMAWGTGGISTSNSSFTLKNSNFEGPTPSTSFIYLLSIKDYEILNNTFNMNNSGVEIEKSGWGKKSIIDSNTIYNISSDAAIKFYSSQVNQITHNDFSNNLIHLLFRNDCKAVIKDENIQTFANSNAEHILSDHLSFPVSIGYNRFEVLEDHSDLGFAEIRCEDHFIDPNSKHDLTHNYWHPSFDERFHLSPSDAFDYTSPIENKNQIMTFTDSLEYIQNNYIFSDQLEEAKQLTKNLIESTNVDWKRNAAIKLLYSIYNIENISYSDYFEYLQSLNIQNYCVTDMINKAKVSNNEFQDPVNWYNSRINNPSSLRDSVYACIDLAYVNLLASKKGNINLTYQDIKNLSSLRDSLMMLIDGKNNETEEEIPSPFVYEIKNYPNPFNPSTTILFTLPEDTNCRIDIYNIKGQKVKTVINSKKTKGKHSVIWNGKDSNNRSVSSGVYFYQLKTDNKTINKKMLLIK